MARNVDYDTAIISELGAYRHYRDENRALSDVLFFTGTEEYDLIRGDEASSASAETVSANYFSLLGVRPYLGRSIAPQDGDRAAASPVVVLSYAYWQRAFAANPAVTGQTISLENSDWSFDPLQNHALRIIGVEPPGFSGVEVGRNPDLYLPGPNSGDSPAFVTIVARLKPGISLAQARASLAPIYQETVRDSKLRGLEKQEDMAGLVVELIPHGLSRVRDKFGLAAQIAMAVVGLVRIDCFRQRREPSARSRHQPQARTDSPHGARRWPLAIDPPNARRSRAPRLGGSHRRSGRRQLDYKSTAALSTKQLPVQLDATLDARVFAFAGVVPRNYGSALWNSIPAISATRSDLTSDFESFRRECRACCVALAPRQSAARCANRDLRDRSRRCGSAPAQPVQP